MLENLKIEYWPIDRIKKYQRNHKKHSPEQINKLVKSVEEFGITQPILINPKGIIIAGEGRFDAFKKKGLDQVPVIVHDLPIEKEKVYRIADNELAVFGVVSDFKVKVEEVKDLKVSPDMLGLTNLKPSDFLFSEQKMKFDIPPPDSISFKDFEKAEKELLDGVDSEESDEQYVKNTPESLQEIDIEQPTNQLNPKAFHFYLEVRSLLAKPQLVKQIEEMLAGLECFIR